MFSLSAFAIAVATLFYGPISDRLGRRPALIGGLLVYLAGSAGLRARALDRVLILGRIVQAAGGCAGIVLTRAIVRDLYGLTGRRRVLAYITMAMVAAPMVAPALGGLLTDLAAGARCSCAGAGGGRADPARRARRSSPETAGTSAQATRRRRPPQGFLRLLRSPPFLGYALQGAFSISVFYAFLAAAPYLMVKVMGRPASEYGLMFVLVSGAFMVGNFAPAASRRASAATA